jgi:23S rRNA (adenine2503-C2)-methyltransferase
MKPLDPSSVKWKLRALSELNAAGAESWSIQHNLPAYRGRQLVEALNRRAIQSLSEMTDFPVTLRERLSSELPVRSLKPRVELRSNHDRTEKVLFELYDGHSVETVLIRSRQGAPRPRQTVCVSSQVGCPAGCTFCATGLGGFTRNLTDAEIVDQVMFFAHRLRSEQKSVSNIVFMGMGEPFLNTASVRAAVRRFTDYGGFGLGQRHITISTVGITPQIRRFADWGGQVNLAISLHAANDALRNELVPYNRRFPLAELLEAVQDYRCGTGRRVSFEYVLLRGVNDGNEQSRDLARLLRPLGGGAHVNLIPWNPYAEGQFVRSDGPDADRFASDLRSLGIHTTIRYSKGLDISAACGQLREHVRAIQG